MNDVKDVSNEPKTSPVTPESNLKTDASPTTTESPAVSKDDSSESTRLYEGVRQLCNDVLYVLHHAYYRGEDAHLVERSKQFIKELRLDVEQKAKQMAKTSVKAS